MGSASRTRFAGVGLAVWFVAGCVAGASPGPSVTPSLAETLSPAITPTATKTATTTPRATPAPTSSSATVALRQFPDGWQLVNGQALEYSVSLPPGSWLSDVVDDQPGMWEQWIVMVPHDTLAFGLIIVRSPNEVDPDRLDWISGDGRTELRVDGVRFIVVDEPEINLTAYAVVDGRLWKVMGESAELPEDAALRELYFEILRMFRFERFEPVEPGPWTAFAPEGARFSIEFPTEQQPSRNIRPVQYGGEFDHYLRNATILTTEGVFVVGWSVAERDLGPDIGHQEAAWLAEGLGGTIVSEGEALVGGHPGYEYVVATTGLRVHNQYLQLGRRAYVLQVIVADPPGTSPLADEFFASFEVEP